MNEKTEPSVKIEVSKNTSESLKWIKENYKVVIQTVFISVAIVLSYVIGRVAMGYEIIAIKDFCQEAVGMKRISINESTYTITVNPPPQFLINGSEAQGIMGNR